MTNIPLISTFNGSRPKDKNMLEKQIIQRAIRIFRAQLLENYPQRTRWANSVADRAQSALIAGEISLDMEKQEFDYDKTFKILSEQSAERGVTTSTYRASTYRRSLSFDQ